LIDWIGNDALTMTKNGYVTTVDIGTTSLNV